MVVMMKAMRIKKKHFETKPNNLKFMLLLCLNQRVLLWKQIACRAIIISYLYKNRNFIP